jgi:hypothetical protein
MNILKIQVKQTDGKTRTVIADSDAWFKELTKEQQKQYIIDHPNSKYAKNAKSRADKEQEDAKKKQKKPHKSYIPVKNKFADKISALPEEHKQFFETEQDKPGSEQRKGIANHIRTNKSEILKHIKGQFVEWGDGCGAIGKLAQGKKISDHEKKALKALVIDAAVMAGAIAITGGFAHGAALAMKHVGFDVLKDIVLKATIRGTAKAMGTSLGHTGVNFALETLASDTKHSAAEQKQNEKILSMLVDKIADLVENGAIPEDAWEKAIAELSKTKPKPKPKKRKV